MKPGNVIPIGRAAKLELTLAGKQVAFTGRLASMTQEEAADLVRRCGGEPVGRPGRRTALLVVGQEGWPFQEDGRMTESLQRAQALQAEGSSLEVVSEQEFLERLRLAGESAPAEVQRLYTTAQLSRILKIAGSTIRAWVRRGLLVPVRREHRLDYFDFRQVAQVKMLGELTAAGVPLGKLRRNLEELRDWLPEASDSLEQLARWEGQDHLLVRLDTGQLAEPSGQLRLVFDDAAAEVPSPESAPPAQPVVVAADVASPEDWLSWANELEESGDLEGAIRAYHKALAEAGPCAETVFDLGNALYAAGRREEAACRFQQAIELDGDYVEAWNNLASVNAELSRWEDAIAAGRRTLALAPDYFDAHYNLAEAYLGAGDPDQAREHGQAYLRYDSRSDWARRLRQILHLR